MLDRYLERGEVLYWQPHRYLEWRERGSYTGSHIDICRERKRGGVTEEGVYWLTHRYLTRG